ncbi:MAG: TonB-dependent receptor [Gammaproteobacteria bacterium]|nr:TonB-dependent receptor [Gammaproteobacteria bacterium]MDE0366492.1 TonB-dependent receptor [Gammaproteobacteria bacterium]
MTAKPIKASQQAAIEAKRLAPNVADIISADAIGRFPDQNLADALGRVPGISIERDQGQARYVSFRGTPKRYTTTAFNGISIPGVENGRIPRFDAYPAVITSQVVANKAITPDMPGESISGYINIKTFSPSEIDGFSGSAEAGLGEQDLGGGGIEKGNLRLSYSNDQFGVVVYGSYNNRKQITDNREPTYSGTEGALFPDRIDFRNYKLEREDEAYGGTLEYYLENSGRVYFTSLYTKFTDSEQRNDFRVYLRGVPALTGTAEKGSIRRLLEYGTYINKTEVNTLGFDLPVGNWDLEASYSKIDTTFDTWLPIPYFIGGNQVSNVFYDLTDPHDPTVTFDENLADVDYSTKLLVDAVGGLYNDNDQFKVDIGRENPWGRFKFGVKYDDRSATGGGAPLATIGKPYPSDSCPARDYVEGPWSTTLNNSIGGFYADNKGLQACLDADGQTRSEFPEDELIAIDETLWSAYVMQTFDLSWGSIIAGVRVEDTDYETVGSKLVGTVSQPLAVKRSYTNVLPSVHATYDINEEQKIRASFSTGISRPSYIEARAAASISEISSSIAGGNPFLKQEESWGIDLAYEWYFDEASLFSLTLFHREIDNVIAESTEMVDGSIYSDIAEPGELWELSAFGNGEDGKLQGIEVSFTGRLDNYLDGFFSGFGVEGNLALIGSEYTAPSGLEFDLPGQSNTNYNLSLFYENYGFSARVTYRYRSPWLDETETGNVFELGEGVYWAEQKRLDLAVRYSLYELTGYQASIIIDANNLTDETDFRYSGVRWNPNQIESFGRRFLIGVRVNF